MAITRIPKYFQSVLSSGKDSDFSIIVFDEEGNKIKKKVHRVVIRQCPYFDAMLDLDCKESKKGRVKIDNITNEVFDYVLRYMYTDSLGDISMDQAIKVIQAADYLQFEDLKKSAVDHWKASFMKIVDNKAIIEAFRTLALSSVDNKYDYNWYDVAKEVVVAMCYMNTDYNIAEESDTFMEFFITTVGRLNCRFAAHTLAKWTLATDIELTKKQRKNRKKIASKLIKSVRLIALSFQSLAILSKTKAFPDKHMLKQIQQRLDRRETPTFDNVEFNLKTKSGRLVIDFEFEGTYVIFRFMGWKEGDDENTVVWEFVNVPKNFNTRVTLMHPRSDDMTWSLNTTYGTVQRSKGLPI